MRRRLGLSAAIADPARCFRPLPRWRRPRLRDQATTAPGRSGIGWRGWGVEVGASSSPDQFPTEESTSILGEFLQGCALPPHRGPRRGDHVTLLRRWRSALRFSKVQSAPIRRGGAGLHAPAFDDHARRLGAENDTQIALMGVRRDRDAPQGRGPSSRWTEGRARRQRS